MLHKTHTAPIRTLKHTKSSQMWAARTHDIRGPVSHRGHDRSTSAKWFRVRFTRHRDLPESWSLFEKNLRNLSGSHEEAKHFS